MGLSDSKGFGLVPVGFGDCRQPNKTGCFMYDTEGERCLLSNGCSCPDLARGSIASMSEADKRYARDMVVVSVRMSEYYSQAELSDWFVAPHPQFDGKSAIELIRENRTSEVTEMIDRLDDGVYL